jgi:hypothetical protein
MLMKRSGLAQVGGEDRRRQALRHGVVQRDGLIERGTASHTGSARRFRGAPRRSARACAPALARIPGLRVTRLPAPAHRRRTVPPCAGLLQRRCMARMPPGRSAGRPAPFQGERGSPIRKGARTVDTAIASCNGACTIRRRAWCSAGLPCHRRQKRDARSARSRSAEGVTMMALLPPSSSRLRPRRGRHARYRRPDPCACCQWRRPVPRAASVHQGLADRRRPSQAPGTVHRRIGAETLGHRALKQGIARPAR